MTIHIRRIVKTRSMRIMGSVGHSENWCGAAPTIDDVLIADARRAVRDGWHVEDRCVVCFDKLMRADFAKSEKVED